jgi:hypothetical protein
MRAIEASNPGEKIASRSWRIKRYVWSEGIASRSCWRVQAAVGWRELPDGSVEIVEDDVKFALWIERHTGPHAEAVFALIAECAVAIGVGRREVEEVDRINAPDNALSPRLPSK